ncbi:hypothetical protein DSO57_1036207 [Entomophthora muscae]|uniref:Uncharacterized protein n=1 Tax=Entomophthora muscae TaxID=34485 RepID=A0ACC2TXS4_9FUNG|nr:hypothetical protein DSO57_1036207 [Entomophthora muscae]
MLQRGSAHALSAEAELGPQFYQVLLYTLRSGIRRPQKSFRATRAPLKKRISLDVPGFVF